ncbi:MAG: iron ABC transporter permease [Erysipelotrichaceae bacterium]|nr:iron ABC transporter permease [Erysipelotrichaceae bacterium]
MKKSRNVFLFFILLLIVIGIVSIMIGSYHMSFHDILQTFLGKGDKLQEFTIYQSRLPRIMLAVLVGSALGVSGSILQSITRNPLAEPGVIGINAGAALFVVLWISASSSAYYSELPFAKVIFIPFIAMIGSLVSMLMIYLLANKKGLQPMRLLLCGIGVNAGIQAIITFYQLNMSKGDYNQVLTWTNGSLWGSSWQYVLLILPIIVILIFIAMMRSRILDVLGLGDELALSVGVAVKKERVFFFVLSTLLAAVATSVAGNIAFLALLGPQIAKKLVTNQYRYLIPLSAIISAIILLVADLFAKNLFSPIEIPVGIMVSILGVPYFLYLMLNRK